MKKLKNNKIKDKNMKLSKKDIKLFRLTCMLLVFLSILIIFFVNKIIGGGLLALSLFFLFTPYKAGDEIK
jgi:uncharacterized membrane protein